MNEEPEHVTADLEASAAPDPRDRRKSARRSGADRRAGTAPPAGVERRRTDRRQGDRRQEPSVAPRYRGSVRSINEYPLEPEELEFINAINAYKERHSRPFPTWSEVLHVLRHLGYRKDGGAAPGGEPGTAPGGESGAADAVEGTGLPGDR